MIYTPNQPQSWYIILLESKVRDPAYLQHISTRFIEERFPPEMPQLFGLHPNAEIGFLTSQGINIFKTVQSPGG